jgi:hypothetical protein
MATWREREVIAALESKGFRLDRSTDHGYYRFYYRDFPTIIRTKMSHGKDEISRKGSLFEAIKNQLKLTASELEKLFNCPMSEAEYTAILIERGHVSEPE